MFILRTPACSEIYYPINTAGYKFEPMNEYYNIVIFRLVIHIYIYLNLFDILIFQPDGTELATYKSRSRKQ